MEKRCIYLPEGDLIDTPENQAATQSLTALMQAQAEGRLLEGRAVRCDVEHNLYVRLPCGEAIIPHCEGALGIAEGVTKDIVLITRVNKPVCFVVTGFRQTDTGCQPVLWRFLRYRVRAAGPVAHCGHFGQPHPPPCRPAGGGYGDTGCGVLAG